MPACPTKPYPTVQPCCRDWRSRRSPKAERCAFLDLPGSPEAVLPKPFGVRVQRLFLLKFSYTQSFDTSALASFSDFAPSSETPGSFVGQAVVPGVRGAPGVDGGSIPSQFSSAFRCRPDGRHQGVAETARL